MINSEIYVRCINCGDFLELHKITLEGGDTDIHYWVTPCQTCMTSECELAYADGVHYGRESTDENK